MTGASKSYAPLVAGVSVVDDDFLAVRSAKGEHAALTAVLAACYQSFTQSMALSQFLGCKTRSRGE